MRGRRLFRDAARMRCVGLVTCYTFSNVSCASFLWGEKSRPDLCANPVGFIDCIDAMLVPM